MVVTESYPAQSGNGSPASRQRRAPRHWILLAVGVLVVAAVVVLGVLAGTYQPVQQSGEYGVGFPGMPSGTGLRTVNNFLNVSNGDTYVPPQSGVFTISESIANFGPEAVTIEAVTILSPQQQASESHGIRPWPLVPAGAVRWRDEVQGSAVKPPTSGTSVAGLTLAPGQDIVIGIPLRSSSACYEPNSSTGADAFYVKVRYLSFTHWVAVPFQAPLILQMPALSGQPLSPGFVCPSK